MGLRSPVAPTEGRSWGWVDRWLWGSSDARVARGLAATTMLLGALIGSTSTAAAATSKSRRRWDAATSSNYSARPMPQFPPPPRIEQLLAQWRTCAVVERRRATLSARTALIAPSTSVVRRPRCSRVRLRPRQNQQEPGQQFKLDRRASSRDQGRRQVSEGSHRCGGFHTDSGANVQFQLVGAYQSVKRR